MSTSERITEITESLNELLQAKNKNYGDAAINPIKIFSAVEPENGICVRLDDKLSRVRNHPDGFRFNDLLDIAGYMILLLADKGITREHFLAQID